MQFKEITDQAFRCVLYLSGCQRPRNIETISRETAAPVASVKKIMSKLCRNCIVNRSLGKESGYSLAKSPEKIYPFDIVNLFEDTSRINRCLEDDRYCNRDAADNGCPVRALLCDIQKQMYRQLKAVSFLDLYEQTDEYKEKCEKLITENCNNKLDTIQATSI